MVAADRLGWLQGPEFVEAQAPQDAANGGWQDTNLSGVQPAVRPHSVTGRAACSPASPMALSANVAAAVASSRVGAWSKESKQMLLVGHAVAAGPKYGVETVHGAFLIGNKQPCARNAAAALTGAILRRITGTSALNRLARSRTLRTDMCVAAHTCPHQCHSHLRRSVVEPKRHQGRPTKQGQSGRSVP